MPITSPFRRSALVLALLAGGAGYASAQTPPAWVGTWGAAPMSDGGHTFGPSQTVRHVVHTSVAGTVARIRLSNEFGSAPVTLRDVQIALAGSGSSIQAGTSKPVTFGGSTTVTLAPGQDVSSDAVTFAVPKTGDVAISYYLPNQTTIQTYHQVENADSWVASGDVSGSTAIPVVSTHSSEFILSGLDVQATALKGSVVTIGASITDGYQSTYGANKRWPNDLATRLNAAGTAVGVINEGITGNGFLQNGAGTSMLTRFSHDVLGQSGVHWVVISDNPINDILDPSGPPTIAALEAGLEQLIGSAHGQGVAEVLDQDAATHDPADPTRYLPADDSGDHLHPGDAGYQAIANAVNLAWFSNMVAPVGPQPGSVYHLVSVGSGMALDNGGSMTNGTAVTQYPLDPANINQHWRLVNVGTGVYHLDVQTSGDALDNAGRATLGSVVTQWHDDGVSNANQNWRVEFIRKAAASSAAARRP